MAKFKVTTALRRGYTLMLRTCIRDGADRLTAYGGFVWPASGPVECPDWEPKKECGNGLHGFLRGAGASGPGSSRTHDTHIMTSSRASATRRSPLVRCS